MPAEDGEPVFPLLGHDFNERKPGGGTDCVAHNEKGPKLHRIAGPDHDENTTKSNHCGCPPSPPHHFSQKDYSQWDHPKGSREYNCLRIRERDHGQSVKHKNHRHRAKERAGKLHDRMVGFEYFQAAGFIDHRQQPKHSEKAAKENHLDRIETLT